MKDRIILLVLEIAFIIVWKLKYWRLKMRSVNRTLYQEKADC